MNDKLPPQIAELLVPLWVWVISLLGALVGFAQEVKPEDTHSTKLFKLIAKCSASALAAILTYHSMLALKTPAEYMIPVVGIAGHSGVVFLDYLATFWKTKVGK